MVSEKQEAETARLPGPPIARHYLYGDWRPWPLLDAIQSSGTNNLALGRWGYVAIALAGTLLGYDNLFGLSTGWMRYMVSELSLYRTLCEFQFNWIINFARLAETNDSQAGNVLLLQQVKEFILQLENLVKQETDAWVLEFQSNIASPEKTLKTEIESRKPGSIPISVRNALAFPEVTVRLNNTPVAVLPGVTERLIDSVPPGRYEVVAVARKENVEKKDLRVVEVRADAMEAVELSLPS